MKKYTFRWLGHLGQMYDERDEEVHPPSGSQFYLAADVEAQPLDESETYRLQMAAIGVAAMSNTPESAAANRITRENPYWTPALEDVYRAIDREMALIAERDKGLTP